MILDELNVSKVFVIAPLRGTHVWTTEIEKWDYLHNLDCSLVVGTAKERTAVLHQSALLRIINRENVHWLVYYYEKNG